MSTKVKAPKPGVPLHRIPPHNLDAEQAVLGGILLDKEAINRTLEVLSPTGAISTATSMAGFLRAWSRFPKRAFP